MLLSECCNAPLKGSLEDPICSECGEHCDFYDDEDTIEELSEVKYV